MHDKYKRRYQAPKAGDRVRHQIAVEAARRLYETVGPEPGDPLGRLKDLSETECYTAKRKAAAVLGHRVRPGDLPSDAEVRDQVVALARSRSLRPDATAAPEESVDEPEDGFEPPALAEVVDRFAVYRLRLGPLEAVKQNPRWHPEGDALYHSLQVFELAREARPYDEEFLLAALLHDVGKAIDPADHVRAAVEALRGVITERTLWLVGHHMDLVAVRDRAGGLSQRARQTLETSEHIDDLKHLRELDEAGRVPGRPVGTVDEALAYIKGLEDETYLGD